MRSLIAAVPVVSHVPVVAPVLSTAEELGRVALALVLVPLGMSLMWATSFSRTHFRIGFATAAGVWALAGVASMLAVATMPGAAIGAEVGIGAGFLILATVLVWVVEGDKTVMEYRAHQKKLVQAAREELERTHPWGVTSVIDPEADDGVEVRVVNGSYHKPIAKVDPITEGDLYHQHVATAEDAASTLNSLSIKVAPGKILAQPEKESAWR